MTSGNIYRKFCFKVWHVVFDTWADGQAHRHADRNALYLYQG